MYHPLLTTNSQFDAVVLASGEFPANEVPLAVLCSTRPLIVCDSALVPLLGYGGKHGTVVPSAIVGDGDSLAPELKDRYASIWHQFDEQEDNDLTKAVRYLLDHYRELSDAEVVDERPRTVAFLGTTGKREDHTLGNLSLMVRYFAEFGICPCFITDYGWFVPASGDNVFATFPRQLVSVFNVNCHRLESRGLKWDTYPFTEFWQGTLNEAVGSECRISADGTYVVFRTYGAKVSTK